MANNGKMTLDRSYTAKEAWGRLWLYARKYKVRIFVGIFCGMLTAGTLVPLFRSIQPVLMTMERRQPSRVLQTSPAEEKSVSLQEQQQRDLAAQENKLSKNIGKIEKYAKKIGLDIQNEDGTIALPLIFILLIVVPVAALVRCALVFLSHYCLAWVGMKVVRDIQCDTLRHIQEQGLLFHGRINVGQVMTRATNDPQLIRNIIQRTLQELVQAPFEIIVSIAFILWSAIQNQMLPTLAIIVIGFPLFMLPVIFFSKALHKWGASYLAKYAIVGGRIQEVFTCIKAVKAYHTENHENRRYEKANDDAFFATIRMVCLSSLVTPAVEVVGIFLICIFIVWCCVAGVRLSMVIPLLAPLLMIYKPLKKVSKLQTQLMLCRAALGRVWSLLDLKYELPEKPDAVSVSSFSDKVVFNNVSFRYATAKKEAVKNASFELKRGQMIAVVGSTGCGKSTMSSLLARFFDPTTGRVTLDGIDLRDIRIASLRDLIGSVQQETLLFNDTIENNIKYGSPNATRDEVVAAAKMANAHDFIISQPQGYDRMAGEKGFALSGGERQRIAIARAILKNPPILILDEATSALDTVTERIVQDAINNLMKDRTVFAIAHRLSTIRSADLILVMQAGEIIERGTHDALYAANGVYRKLCDMQHQK